MKPFGLSLLILGLVLGNSLQAQASPLVQNNPQKQEIQKDPSQLGSLVKVPQSTGFYFATMNHEAVFEAVTKSNAWKAIKKSEVARGMKSAYRRGRTKGYAEYNEDNPFAQYLQFYGETFDNFIFKSAWEVASQVIGNETFIYVDNDMADFISVARKAQLEAFQFMADEMDFDNVESEELSDQMGIQMITNMLKNLTDVDCPTMIIGSRLEDPDEFKGMLELLRSAAESGMDEFPPEADFIRDGWNVIDKDDSYFLTLSLDLAELPLDELLADADDAELVAAIEEFVLNKQGSIALGIADNLLLLGVASDVKKLTKFGSQDKLIDLPQLARLNESIQKNEPIIGAYYFSEKYAKAQFSFADSIKAYMPMVEKGFVEGFLKGADVSQAERDRFSKELSDGLKELATDLKAIWPEPAFGYGFAKLDTEGIRGHAYSGATHPLLDGSKPLELADHASPEVVLLVANRPRDFVGQYGLAAKWSSKLYQALKSSALQRALETIEEQDGNELFGFPDLMKDDDPETESSDKKETLRKLTDEILKDFETFAGKFDQTTRQRVLPAINGQELGLFVELVDAESWHPEIPQTETPLPLPLPALVMGHNNQADLVLATEEYLDHVTKFYESVKSKVPEEDQPEVAFDFDWDSILEKSESDSGTLFQFPVPSELELDSSVRPGILVSDDKIIAAFLQKQAEALTKPRTSNLFGPASEKKPSFALFFYDNRALMKGIETWNKIALEVAEEEALKNDILFDLSQYEADRDTLQFSEEQLRVYFQHYWNLGECWKGMSSRSYAQDGGTAAEFLLKFSDVEPSN